MTFRRSCAALLLGILGTSWFAATDAAAVARSRAAVVETTACGNASKTDGVAVLLGGSEVLVAAHVVIGAGSVTVDLGAGPLPANVVVLDQRADLALLDVPSVDAPAISIADPIDGDAVTIGLGTGEVIEAAITRLVEVRIEAVRSTERISRFGFEIDRRVDLGDSGAGVYNASGELVGMVFGRSATRPDRSFAVRSEEVRQVRSQMTQKFVCVAAEDRVLSADTNEHADD